MKECAKKQFENIINDFSQNVKEILTKIYLEQKTKTEITLEFDITKENLVNLQRVFYDFFENKTK